MRNLYIIFLSLILISCSTSDNHNSFDYGTDRGYTDLTVVFDDGTDYYIKDKKSSTAKKKTIDKSVTEIPSAKYSPKEQSNSSNNDSLKYAVAPGNTKLLYPIKSIAIKSKYNQTSFKGLEFKVGNKTEIKSSAPGMVIFSGNKASLGNTIFVYHNNGFVSIYSNLETLNYKKGDFIKSSDYTLGYASESFKFELRQRTNEGVVAVNPEKYLKER